ncbi:aminoglycoside phosphotransferase family protein [Actinopolymorpha pittospori]|uniref:Aminoglycoside phosphotransferase n=1 Tax=Actinopolymorpha pittospori TaxID=648752 RepID=A0A927N4D1_9ACTN|nr:hypothetical protein [Actinopolymorpha pittospori]
MESTGRPWHASDPHPAEVPECVAAALGRGVEEVRSGQVELVARSNVPGLATVGIWRQRGSDWSSVVKVVGHADHDGAVWGSDRDPVHPFYWRREADAFEHPLLASLRGGLRAPRPYGVQERRDGSVAVWMEDVEGDPGSGWALPRYRLAAAHLGRMQGALAESPDLLTPWLSRGWLRLYVERRAGVSAILDDVDAWRHPFVRAVLPVRRAAEFAALWDVRGGLLDVLAGYPRTLCQLDFHPRNLFDVDGDTVAIDWAFAGVGALGEDLGTLLVDAVADFHLPPTVLPELFETLVAGYADGLAAAGRGLPRADVRRAVAAGAAAKYGWLVPAFLTTATAGRPMMNGRPVEDAAPFWAACAVFLLGLAREALG